MRPLLTSIRELWWSQVALWALEIFGYAAQRSGPMMQINPDDPTDLLLRLQIERAEDKKEGRHV